MSIKNIDKSSIGNQARLSGEFGEAFIAYLLSKRGVEVVRADTAGFDLFAIDQKGKLFPKKKIVGISVRARISKIHNKFVPTIPVGSRQINNSGRKWGIDAYIGIVVGSQNNRLDVFIFPLADLQKLQGKTRRKDVIAVSELYNNPTTKTIKLF